MDEQLFQKINRLRKSGSLADAWDLGCTAVQEHPNDLYLKGAFFWVCFSYLKEVQSSIKTRAAAESENFTPSEIELQRINFLIDWIVWLNIPPGGYEYRSLLLIFQKNLECVPALVLLLMRWSDSLFTDEDKQAYVSERGESPSLMLKFSRKVAKAWMVNKNVRQLPVETLCSLFLRTKEEANDKQQQIWLDYDEAKCLILDKKYDQARACVLTVLQKKQTESWAWGALATTYRVEDPSAAIVLFSKALCCAHDDTFALPILKGIAALLAEQRYENEASMCVKRALSCYVEQGWKVKSDLEHLMSQSWYRPDADLEALQSFLDTQAGTALDYLFGERELCHGVVLNVHASNKGFHVYVNRNQRFSVRLGLFRSNILPIPGDYVRLTLSAQDKSVIASESCESVTLDDVEFKEGSLSIKEKGFGFVESTFVPKSMIEPEMDGKEVRVMRLLDFDKTKGKHSWKALTIELV